MGCGKMTKDNWKEFMSAAAIRALHTFAQTAIGMITVGAAFSEVNWLQVLSVSGVSAVVSILKSIATGLPEVKKAGL